MVAGTNVGVDSVAGGLLAGPNLGAGLVAGSNAAVGWEAQAARRLEASRTRRIKREGLGIFLQCVSEL